jgi:hypothetical protein
VLRLPHFLDIQFTDISEVFGLTHQPPFTPRDILQVEGLGKLTNPVTQKNVQMKIKSIL